MAIIKANFIPHKTNTRAAAKAHIRYIENRRGKDGVRIKRTLFGVGGQMGRHQAYGMIDQAGEESTYFRIVLSPDPVREDTAHDVLLREITGKTMAHVEEHIGKQVQWVAAIHDDHTTKRHVHILAVARERLLPVQAMRQTATNAALEQRRELDAEKEQQHTREREGEEWERER